MAQGKSYEKHSYGNFGFMPCNDHWICEQPIAVNRKKGDDAQYENIFKSRREVCFIEKADQHDAKKIIEIRYCLIDVSYSKIEAIHHSDQISEKRNQ
ncbi:MAG: hypothetical protein WDN75_20505 [Bacteroidota bacterium]